MDLGVGIVDFMGGEPLVWKYIFKAVEECSKHYIITNLNTNGLILNHEVVDRLGRSGLDHLNVSIDGIKSSFVSKKCLDNNEILISSLERARDKWKIKVRVNSVIHKTNFAELKKLIEILHKHNIPLTLGFVVPPLGYEGAGNKLFFSLEDRDSLKKIVSYIIKKKKEGYKIIDPNSYFLQVFKFLNKEEFWQCNYPTRFGWINIAPLGKIRSCTKKMDELDFNFLDLTPKRIKKLKKELLKGVSKCNLHCYSNCAYDSWYFKKYKLRFFRELI